jgi:hypothetical protein
MKLLVLTQLVLGLQAAQLVPGTADDVLVACSSGQDARNPGLVVWLLHDAHMLERNNHRYLMHC